MAFEESLALLAVGLESVPGTAVATTAVVRLRSIEATPSVEMSGDKMATGDFGQSEKYSGERSVGFKGFGYLSLPPAVATAPDWSILAVGSGFIRSTHGATGQSWAQRVAGANTSLSLRYLAKESGAAPTQRAILGAGAMSSWKLSAGKRGEPIKFDVDFKAAYTSEADVANGSLVSLGAVQTTVGMQLLGWLATLHGVTCRIDSFEIEGGQEIDMVPDQGNTNTAGIERFRVKTAVPKVKISVEVPAVATLDIRSRWVNVTTGSFIMSNQGTGASLFLFRFPVVQIADVKYKYVNGVLYADLELHVQRNGSADATMNAEDMWEMLHGSKT